jgi:hypothetical protein
MAQRVSIVVPAGTGLAVPEKVPGRSSHVTEMKRD